MTINGKVAENKRNYSLQCVRNLMMVALFIGLQMWYLLWIPTDTRMHILARCH